mgnify:CR=1 FL=1
MSESPELILRYMRVTDVPDVTAIDQASFAPPWPASSYRFEIKESNISYMAVLELRNHTRRPNAPQTGVGWWRLFTGVWGPANNVTGKGRVVGYSGLWNIAEEAHISTIASHPDYRGRKYGEILLVGMIRRAIRLRAGYIVLEVRVSNTVAQNLYKKYGFTIHGTKPEYYHQDKEDAYDMRVQLTTAYVQDFERQYQALVQTLDFRDVYSHTHHPRLAR